MARAACARVLCVCCLASRLAPRRCPAWAEGHCPRLLGRARGGALRGGAGGARRGGSSQRLPPERGHAQPTRARVLPCGACKLASKGSLPACSSSSEVCCAATRELGSWLLGARLRGSWVQVGKGEHDSCEPAQHSVRIASGGLAAAARWGRRGVRPAQRHMTKNNLLTNTPSRRGLGAPQRAAAWRAALSPVQPLRCLRHRRVWQAAERRSQRTARGHAPERRVDLS